VKMTKREIVKLVIEGKGAGYVPWHCDFTVEAAKKLRGHFGTDDLDRAIDNHFVNLSNDVGYWEDIGDDRVRDVFGVVWDRSVDKDIGNVEGCVLAEPSLKGYEFPDPVDSRFFADIEGRIEAYPDCFRVYYNIAQVKEALKYDIDAVRFGDDWGAQRGLQMGPVIWREFIYPELKRMYSVVKESGRYVYIHCCGKVTELFDDLIGIGVDCFNPFQPEVMDVFSLMEKYRGRLCFHGGMSTQRTLPYGSVEEVRVETERLLAAGRDGGYIFSPAHAVPKDVGLENMTAFIEVLQNQEGYRRYKSS